MPKIWVMLDLQKDKIAVDDEGTGRHLPKIQMIVSGGVLICRIILRIADGQVNISQNSDDV